MGSGSQSQAACDVCFTVTRVQILTALLCSALIVAVLADISWCRCGAGNS